MIEWHDLRSIIPHTILHQKNGFKQGSLGMLIHNEPSSFLRVQRSRSFASCLLCDCVTVTTKKAKVMFLLYSPLRDLSHKEHCDTSVIGKKSWILTTRPVRHALPVNTACCDCTLEVLLSICPSLWKAVPLLVRRTTAFTQKHTLQHKDPERQAVRSQLPNRAATWLQKVEVIDRGPLLRHCVAQDFKRQAMRSGITLQRSTTCAQLANNPVTAFKPCP